MAVNYASKSMILHKIRIMNYVPIYIIYNSNPAIVQATALSLYIQ